ncbi:hydroxyacid dehydrogenase [Arthrobacter psychrochitiniphilus]|uniref:Hydroxyacid dehydrogenase n=1 Tax=Arthrobacter psychrochitiniphilus TaxID=291045 RepID=A0A2V3DSV2_9MICC|nr:hydroxyacid dehydrogenase [Arthrobacter psychrochitiniphilus]NYG18739.1 phosphoglycerate dehydrogenase-like enzyme [Arthrobacter psychrochitiniphilus]PXA66333.1 hydroxyacid dehydrogenase [Arthrobacter psychrochitiniphilus]
MTQLPTALILMSADTFATQFDMSRLDRLRSLASLCGTFWADSLDHPEIQDQLPEVEVLITSWGVPLLDAPALERLPALKAVFHCAGSVRTFATPALWERGITVCNGADSNAIPVAEFTFASIILAGKRAQVLSNDSRNHRGELSFAASRGKLGNLGRTIGIVGYSRIGRRVVDLLRQLEDVTILLADPYADPAEVTAAGATLLPLEDLLGQVDVLSIHAPSLPSTHHMIGARELAALADHTTIINTARGDLIDTDALLAECRTGRLTAILDVTDPEPLPADNELYDLPNVILTPHVAGSLGAETRRMVDEALADLGRYTEGKPLVAQIRAADMAHHA